jgi:hypothetical protein
MSYNGSGTFVINTSGQPVVAGTVISSTAFNALTADLATGLSTAITKDGQTTTTARIPFAAGINSSLTTDSSSTSTGSIITAGGVGIANGAWASANYSNATGATSVVGTNGATFYITGVQLEKGSTATSFDYRPYGTELQLAQRYFVNLQTVASPNIELCIPGATTGTTNWTTWMPYPMRAAPTATLATSASVRQAGTTYNVTTWSTAVTGSYPQGFYLYALVASAMTANSAAHFYAYQSVNNFSAEL